jgi:hypothetical protein
VTTFGGKKATNKWTNVLNGQLLAPTAPDTPPPSAVRVTVGY